MVYFCAKKTPLTTNTAESEELEGGSLFNGLLKLDSVHILKQLNDFNGVLSDIFLQCHFIEFLKAALDLPKLRNQSHLRTQEDVFEF